jgi:hypothetical protein
MEDSRPVTGLSSYGSDVGPGTSRDRAPIVNVGDAGSDIKFLCLACMTSNVGGVRIRTVGRFLSPRVADVTADKVLVVVCCI